MRMLAARFSEVILRIFLCMCEPGARSCVYTRHISEVIKSLSPAILSQTPVSQQSLAILAQDQGCNAATMGNKRNESPPQYFLRRPVRRSVVADDV